MKAAVIALELLVIGVGVVYAVGCYVVERLRRGK